MLSKPATCRRAATCSCVTAGLADSFALRARSPIMLTQEQIAQLAGKVFSTAIVERDRWNEWFSPGNRRFNVILLSIAPCGRAPASPKGVCCKCGVVVGRRARYCDTHRSERFSEQWTAEWEKRRATGIDNAHGGEAERKRSESMRRTCALKGVGV